ncbi:MAG: peptidoglycan DD-metalloendopeptidase family protein [Actinobacteria bacterium]|nr:peptidoglycan DD-metalloendopeptidase family protein [Actinomycetota bacterium]
MAYVCRQKKGLGSWEQGGPGRGRLPVIALLALAVGLLVSGMAGSASSATTTSRGDKVVLPILFPFLEHREWRDDYGAPRSGHDHQGNDILAPKGTPVVAVVSGTVDWLNFTGKPARENPYPEYYLLLHGDDGNDYFYVHLNNDTPGTDDGKGGPEHAYAPGLTNGSRVQMGQIIAFTGDSGNAEDSTPHLHFEIHIGGWVSGGSHAVNPYWSLKAAPTYDEWIAAGGGPVVPRTTVTWGTTTITRTTTTVSTTTTTRRPPGGQIDPGMMYFADVYRSDWFRADVEMLCVAGVVKGSADGNFMPYSSITRAQFAAYLARAFLPDRLTSVVAEGAQVFTDVKPSYWGYREIQAAASAGLVKGVDGRRFAPESPITRVQMAVMVGRALDALEGEAFTIPEPSRTLLFSDIPPGHWAESEVLKVAGLKIVNGYSDGVFLPESEAQRCQAAAVIARALRLYRSGANS